MTLKANNVYSHFKADVKYETIDNIAHCMPTDLYVESEKGSFINHCGTDIAGKVLSHVVPENGQLVARQIDW